MIHVAIYDRNPSAGLELGDLSLRFPEEYRSAVVGISESFGTPDESDAQQCDALRYGPLKQKYLLSLVQRMEAGRKYNRIIHYLLDRQEAEVLLSWNLTDLAAALKKIAHLNAQQQQEALNRSEFYSALKAPFSVIPSQQLRHALLVGACLKDTTKKVRMVLSDVEQGSLKLLSWLMGQLPPALRIQMRFNTNVSIPQEGNGCCLLFCTSQTSRKFESGVSGGELADVCVCNAREGCDMQLLEQEFEWVRPLLEASELSIENAQALFGTDGDWEKYLKLVAIPYQSPRMELLEIIALCGSRRTAQWLEKEGYPRQKLEGLARNTPGWLQNDPEVFRVVQKFWDKPATKPRPERTEHKKRDWDAGNENWCAANRRKPVDPAFRKNHRQADCPLRPGMILLIFLCTIVLVLMVIIMKLLLGGIQVTDEHVVLQITASAKHYMLRCGALSVSCTALGAVLVLAVQQLLRMYEGWKKNT